jgi:hypothetical protein
LKKLLIICGLIALCASSDGKKNAESEDNGLNSEENVKENSGENISPQLEYDSANRTDVDTVSTPAGADKQVE